MAMTVPEARPFPAVVTVVQNARIDPLAPFVPQTWPIQGMSPKASIRDTR